MYCRPTGFTETESRPLSAHPEMFGRPHSAELSYTFSVLKNVTEKINFFFCRMYMENPPYLNGEIANMHFLTVFEL